MHSHSRLPLIFLALTAVLTLPACQSKPPPAPPKPAVPDNSPIGTVQLTMGGDLRVMLLRKPDTEGKAQLIGQELLTYKPGTPDFARYMKHVGGLVPGQSKPIPPFR